MSRPIAVHVGRHGQVAGGMTQVVNGYLDWSFDLFDTGVIRSRDGSRGIRAIVVALAAAIRIARLRGRDRTVVVVHLSERGSFVREGGLMLLARARGFATVAHLHGSEFVQFSAAYPRIVRTVLRSAHLVVTLSDESSTAARRFVTAASVMLIPNAVPAGRSRDKERLVVFGGAVRRRKGVDVLVDAWRLVGQRHPAHDWRLLFAGPVIEETVVPERLESAEFLGALDHDELMELLERSSVAVLPSRDEAMPMFILEAMARSNLVVATPVGGVPDVLRDGAGELVPVGDSDALADALERAVTDSAHRKASAKRARAAFDAGYSAEAVFPLVERAWAAALDQRSRRAVSSRRRRSRTRMPRR